MQHKPGGNVSRRNVFVRPDVLNDDDDCYVPGADNTQHAKSDQIILSIKKGTTGSRSNRLDLTMQVKT